MLNMRKSFAVALATAATVFAACAKETTAEERKREENDRAYKRLEPATGTYNGYALDARARRIPLQVAVVQQRSPTGVEDNPALSVSLRVGLMGGVTLTSPNASYDWGAKRLVATFRPAAGGAQKFVELRGRLEGNKLLDAVIVGPRIGSLKLDLSKDAKATVSDFQETRLALRPEAAGNSAFLLTLKRSQNDIAGPETSDLATLPGLEASLRFPSMGKVPEQASAVIYDPFTGVLEVDFQGRTKLRFTDLFDKRSYGEQQAAPLNLDGEISFGAQRLQGVNASSQPQDLRAAEAGGTELPPKTYTGIYEGSAGGLRFRSLALLDYLGSDGQNAGETPFRSFPNMRMRLFLCSRGRPFLSRQLDLKSMDHLAQRARFNDVNPASAANSLLEVQFKNGWNEIEGVFLSPAAGDGAGSSRGAQLTLVNDPRDLKGCGDVESLPGSTPLLASDTDTTPEESLALFSTLLQAPVPAVQPPPSGDPSALQYTGVLLRSESTAVPASLVIFPKRNPTGGSEEPTLQATLRLGFFGGVTIASEPAFFDWGNGRISAAFKRPSGTPLEIKTLLQPDELSDATLVGPNLGTSVLRLSRNGTSYFDNIKENTFRARLTTARPAPGGVANAEGLMAINRKTEDLPAPANIDLPILPALEASLRLDGIAQTPQVAQRMTYDPLRGALDLQISGASTVEFREVFLTLKQGSTNEWETAQSFEGRVLMGAAQQGFLTLERAALTPEDFNKLQQLPPRGFVGTYVGGMPLNAVAYVEYAGTTGTNSAEYPFPAFPNLRMTINLCLGKKPFHQIVLTMTTFDVLSGKTLFKASAAQKNGDLDLQVSKGWETLEGVFRNTDGSGGSTGGNQQGARLNLRARPTLGAQGCNEI